MLVLRLSVPRFDMRGVPGSAGARPELAAMPVTVERRFQMMRISAGDYLLPSNDQQTMWRISSYEEDGSASWTDDKGREHKVRGTFWQVARMTMAKMTALIESPVTDDSDILDWNEWEHYAMGLRSRAAAIEDALACRR